MSVPPYPGSRGRSGLSPSESDALIPSDPRILYPLGVQKAVEPLTERGQLTRSAWSIERCLAGSCPRHSLPGSPTATPGIILAMRW